MTQEIQKKLWKKVQRYCRFLQMLPFIRMVGVCNNLAFGRVDEKSDIDLFIIARSGRLFTVRAFVTFLMHFLGVRRHGKKIRGRFCLSFFADDESLDFSKIAISKDIYLAFWIKSMLPVIDDSVSLEFLEANFWARRFFEDEDDFSIDTSKVFKSSGFFGALRKGFEYIFYGQFGNFFETKMKKWQLKRASHKAQSVENDLGLVLGEHILKFHNLDRRKYYRREWLKRYGEEKVTDQRFLSLVEDSR